MMRDESAHRWSRWLRRRGTAGGLFVMLAALGVVGTHANSAAQPENTTQQTVAAAKPAAGPQIEIKEHKYNPAAVTVPVGATVTWINHDDDVHTVTSSAQAFTSAGIDSDETFTYRFAKPGTYVYFCTLHPLMTAKIVVR